MVIVQSEVSVAFVDVELLLPLFVEDVLLLFTTDGVMFFQQISPVYADGSGASQWSCPPSPDDPVGGFNAIPKEKLLADGLR